MFCLYYFKVNFNIKSKKLKNQAHQEIKFYFLAYYFVKLNLTRLLLLQGVFKL